jgi:hypothetical protein
MLLVRPPDALRLPGYKSAGNLGGALVEQRAIGAMIGEYEDAAAMPYCSSSARISSGHGRSA